MLAALAAIFRPMRGLTLDVSQSLNFVPHLTVTLTVSTPVEQLPPKGAYGAFKPVGDRPTTSAHAENRT
jgi:hypothetical protein